MSLTPLRKGSGVPIRAASAATGTATVKYYYYYYYHHHYSLLPLRLLQ